MLRNAASRAPVHNNQIAWNEWKLVKNYRKNHHYRIFLSLWSIFKIPMKISCKVERGLICAREVASHGMGPRRYFIGREWAKTWRLPDWHDAKVRHRQLDDGQYQHDQYVSNLHVGRSWWWPKPRSVKENVVYEIFCLKSSEKVCLIRNHDSFPLKGRKLVAQ